MPPLQLLSRMAPLALVQMAFSAFAFGELSDLASHWQELKGGSTLYVVLVTGIGSFSLNLCSLQANKVTSPLTLSIMANVKQVNVLGGGFRRFFKGVVGWRGCLLLCFVRAPHRMHVLYVVLLLLFCFSLLWMICLLFVRRLNGVLSCIRVLCPPRPSANQMRSRTHANTHT